MTRTMYDSDQATAIPTDATMVAGYIDGDHPWTAHDWARFPHATRIRIARHPMTNDGDVIDCEAGLATPLEAVSWVQMRRAAGLTWPICYCSLDTWHDIAATFDKSGVVRPLWWIAHWTGIPTIPTGAIGAQYAASPTLGHHYDLSVMADYIPGIDKNGGPAVTAPIPFTEHDHNNLDQLANQILSSWGPNIRPDDWQHADVHGGNLICQQWWQTTTLASLSTVLDTVKNSTAATAATVQDIENTLTGVARNVAAIAEEVTMITNNVAAIAHGLQNAPQASGSFPIAGTLTITTPPTGNTP